MAAPRAPAVLLSPEPEAACGLLRRHVGTRLVQLVGTCTIDYRGRAASTLGSGERILMVKPDGA
ncbi:MAG: endonuclease NucS, partial [bacterium]